MVVSSYGREDTTTNASSDSGAAETRVPPSQATRCTTTPACGVDLVHTFGNFYFSETGLMTPFRLASTNLRTQGLACEVSERGMLQLSFEQGR